jgi:hypothetical protein
MCIRFLPWVGENYPNGCLGLRTLIVCESHYGARENERPLVTSEIIKALALGEKNPLANNRIKKHPHFAKIMNSILNKRGTQPRSEKEKFWSSVAYYNYIQEFISAPRVKPTKTHWQKGEKAYIEVLETLQPNLIISYSLRNGEKLRNISGDISVAIVNHPSSGFSYLKVNPKIEEAKKIAFQSIASSRDFYFNEEVKSWINQSKRSIATPGSHLSIEDKLSLITQRKLSMSAHDANILKFNTTQS